MGYPYSLRMIKDRDYELKHLVDDKDRVQEIKIMTIQVGLTCKYEETESGYQITIKGISEEELKDFLMLAINNDYFNFIR